jgi:endonuclease-3
VSRTRPARAPAPRSNASAGPAQNRRAVQAALPRESADARARRALEIVRRLRTRYPDTKLPLRHHNPLQLLIATMLSAQSTDAQVNRVTPALFKRYQTAADFAGARTSELEKYVHSTGFFHAKTRAIQRATRVLVDRYGGHVPRTLEELVELPGVGRKTANVVLSGFGVPGIVVDTHVRRLSRRLALTAHHDPEKIEQDLMPLIPRKEWSAFSLRLIYLGREICFARRPRCPICPLRDVCPSSRYGGMPPWMTPAGTGASRTGRTRPRASTRARTGAPS